MNPNFSILKRNVFGFLCALSVLVVPGFYLSGCHPAALIVPSYIQSVGVETVQNQTSYYGLETALTQATIRQFQVDGRLPLDTPDKSDMVVKVIIKRYVEEPILYDPKTNYVLQYRLSIVYDLASVDQKERKTFSEDSERTQSVFYYTPQYNGAATETKEQAQARLEDDTSRAIVRRVLEGY
ncbi:MAG TPA: LPS assembly lipoprotein LptE [bacterium]|nr:LPS assembly lipoprotein LptE [bacterium]